MDPFNEYFIVLMMSFPRVELFDVFFFHAGVEQSPHHYAES